MSLSGVLLSNLAHLCSIYVLYFLSKGIYVKSDHAKQIALGAALLHIVSPAGIFLSSPYTESLFAFLNFSGSALYLRGMSRLHGHATMSQRLQVVAAGCVFGIATTIRSNGLLSGLPFLYDAVARTWAIANHGLSSRRLYDLASLMIGGLLVLSGLLVPQIVAYRMYCTDSIADARQPWCSRTIPSIYAWVQERYW
jgi:phosphatidylinositol glycan class V